MLDRNKDGVVDKRDAQHALRQDVTVKVRHVLIIALCALFVGVYLGAAMFGAK